MSDNPSVRFCPKSLKPSRLHSRIKSVNAGFTLLETALALAILGLIAALALPRAIPNSSTSLRIKAFEIAALMRTDRNTALRTGRTVETIVNMAGRFLQSGANGSFVTLPDHLAIRLAGQIPNDFRFYPNGTSSGGEIILGASSAAVSVHVDSLTSAISIRRGVNPDGA
jgi:general secretion pathway protein H